MHVSSRRADAAWLCGVIRGQAGGNFPNRILAPICVPGALYACKERGDELGLAMVHTGIFCGWIRRGRRA